MYDIVLISPLPVPGQEPVRDAYDPADYVNVSTALAYLGSAVRGAGFSVKIFDATIELYPSYNWEDFKKRIIHCQGLIYGINVHATCAYPQCLRIADLIKKNMPDSVVILGGIAISFMYNMAFTDTNNIDYIVLGEGEETLVELVQCIINNEGRIDEIKGISFKRNDEIILTNPRPLITPLDEILPPAWDLYDIEKIRELCQAGLGLSASRGCIGKCTFCSDRNFWQKQIRYHSVDRFISDINMIMDLGINKFQLTDDNLTCNRTFVIDACNRIIEKGLQIEWFANCRADSLDEEMISILKKAGCNRILIGIESGSHKILKNCNKGEPPEIMRKSIHLLNKYGIETIGTCIVGLPGENYETFAETIKFTSDLNLSSLCFYPFIPFPGCDIWNNPEKYDISIESQCFEEYIEPYVVICTRELTSNQIQGLLLFARHYAFLVSTKLNSYDAIMKMDNIKRKYLFKRRGEIEGG